jgi:hypothetical protein
VTMIRKLLAVGRGVHTIKILPDSSAPLALRPRGGSNPPIPV